MLFDFLPISTVYVYSIQVRITRVRRVCKKFGLVQCSFFVGSTRFTSKTSAPRLPGGCTSCGSHKEWPDVPVVEPRAKDGVTK